MKNALEGEGVECQHLTLIISGDATSLQIAGLQDHASIINSERDNSVFVVCINSDIWWSFGKDSCFHRSIVVTPINYNYGSSLSWSWSIRSYTRQRIGKKDDREWLDDGQAVDSRSRRSALYVHRPRRSFYLTCYSHPKLNYLMQIRTIRTFDFDGWTYRNRTFCADLSFLVLRTYYLSDYHERLQRHLYM